VDVSFDSRVGSFRSVVANKLAHIVLKKETNLCLSADLHDFSAVLFFADQLGPQICALKVSPS
jgi:orotidine-5'-phosphate decarboxylase